MHVPALITTLLAAAGAWGQVTGELPVPKVDPSPLTALAPALRSEVELALKNKDHTKAEQILARELERRPDARLYTFLGSLFFLDGQYLNAGIALKKADVLVPLAEADRFTLAMCYVILKMPDRAARELTKLAADAPVDSRYRYWLARLDFDAKRYTAALEGFRAVLKLDPGHVRARDNLGLIHEALGENDAAIENYRLAHEVNKRRQPCSPWPGHNLGTLLRKIGRVDEARPFLEEAVRCEAAFAPAQYQLGLVLEKQGHLADALAVQQRAAAADPKYADPHYALGRLYRRTGDAEAAAREFRLFESLRPKRTVE